MCNCYCLCKGYKQRNKEQNHCCLHEVVYSATRNCVNNKNIDLKLKTNLFLFYLQSTSSYFKRFLKLKTLQYLYFHQLFNNLTQTLYVSTFTICLMNSIFIQNLFLLHLKKKKTLNIFLVYNSFSFFFLLCCLSPFCLLLKL